MPELVAIDLAGGPQFVRVLQSTWADGDAAFPVDQRLPSHARLSLFDTIQPTIIVDREGRRRIDGQPVEDGDALVIATSGSSGVPKGVILTHVALDAAAAITVQALGTSSDDTWLACLPLCHIGGMGVVTRALHSGAGLVVHDSFDADRVAAAAAGGATAVSLVATALARIDPDQFRVIVVGGSRPPTTMPANAWSTYGLTETGGGVVYNRRPLDGVRIKIAADGQVLIQSPTTMRCYRDGTTTVDDNGWLHTGDLGTIDQHGQLSIAGRIGDMIVTGGENVWPTQVEDAIRSHPDVADAAVRGLVDAEWGQRVVAWIVPVRSTEPPSLEAIRDHVAALLPRFMAPRELRMVQAIPRTALGKVARFNLE